MKIYDPTGVLITELLVNDNSFRYRTIAGEDSLTLYCSLPEHMEVPVGAWTEFEGERYELLLPENFKKKSTEEFEYTLVMEAAQGRLKKYKFRDTTTRKLKFSYTARPHEHLQMLVDNLNNRESGTEKWTANEVCVEGVEQTISYNHTSCREVLQQIAEAFNTEWEIKDKQITLRKVEYNKENPLPLSYGKGNGFKPGLGRSNYDSSHAVETLFVQGGDKNIDPSKYGAQELLLPREQVVGCDGTYYDHQEGFHQEEARWYRSDADGFSIHRVGVELKTQAEDSLDCSHIYPKTGGTVTRVEVINEENHFYDFIDTGIADALDYNDYRIGEEPMTVIFQEGMLAGKELEVNYQHSQRRFEIVPQEIDGRIMPDPSYRPQEQEHYLIFGIMMPEDVNNDALRTGASWEMFREAVRYFYEHEEPHYSFTGELDGIWAKKDWLNIGGRIVPGGYVWFTDDQFQQEGKLIRITGVKEYLNNPQSPTIELSNTPAAGSVSSQLGRIDQNEVVTDNQHKASLQFTRRRFRDTIETMGMLEQALLENFTNAITPITVQTMSMLVGDESLQFRFVTNKTNPQEIAHTVKYENGRLIAPAGILQHMTLGIDSITSAHKPEDYFFWDMEAFTSALLEEDSSYYLYAKVARNGTTGSFYVSKEVVGLEEEANYYHLLMGILNSAYDGERSYVSLYGFTEILPGRITTDRIVSSDGENYMDFTNNAVRIGNTKTYLDFNSKGDGVLRLKGSLFQNENDDESPMGVFRGEYQSSYTYYNGDEVTRTVSGITSTYRYIHTNPSGGNPPPNATYWILVASGGSNGIDGQDGQDGDYFEYRYAVNGSKSDPPRVENVLAAAPSGWSTTVPAVGSLEYLWCIVAKKSASGSVLQEWSTPVRISGIDGEKGEDGEGPAMVFRGEYKSGTAYEYYGNSERVDCVKYNSAYYIARTDAGTFSNVTPGGDTNAKWNYFGAQFDSVATDLLLAPEANIANFIFRNERMESQTSSGSPNIILDGKNNLASFAAGKVTFTKDEAKIGSFEIKDGDIIGYDSDGAKRIQISQRATPSIDQTTDGTVDKLSSRAVGSYTIISRDTGDMQGNGFDSDFDFNNKIITDDVIYFNQEYSLGTDYWYDRSAPGHIQFNLNFEMAESAYITVDATNSISNTNAETNNQIGIYRADGTRVTNIGTARTLLDKGSYYFYIYLSYTARPALDTGGPHYITTSLRINSITIERLLSCTIIGNDGIVSRWGSQKYLSFRNEVGFEVRFGNYGLQITEQGLKKLSNGSWVSM